jgi:hypothetical protein
MAKTRLVVDLTEIEFIGLTAQARASGLTIEDHVRHVLGAEKVEINGKDIRKRAAKGPAKGPAKGARKKARAKRASRKSIRKAPRHK